MRGDMIQARLERRIRESAYELTVVYPPIRPVPTGTAPLSTLVNPLYGPPPTQQVVQPEPTPETAGVTMPCLWLDVTSLALSSPGDRRVQNVLGLVVEANALARVLVADAALSPNEPYGKTVFDAADHVEVLGKRYRVLRVEPVSASFYLPVSYYVWLKA